MPEFVPYRQPRCNPTPGGDAMQQEDPLANALFVASLSTCSHPEPKGDPTLDAKVQEALDRLPEIVACRERFDDWAPLLKVNYGDALAASAAEWLKRMLEDRGIKSELRPNPWMADMSKYLFIDVDNLVKATGGTTK